MTSGPGTGSDSVSAVGTVGEAGAKAGRIEDVLARLVHRGSDPLIVFGADARIRYVNPACVWALEQPAEAFVGLAAEELSQIGMAPAVAVTLARAVEAALEHGIAGRFAAEMRRGPERPSHVDVAVVPDRAPDGTIVGCAAIGRDVSGARLTEERWRATTERLGIMASTSGAAFCGFDYDGNVLYANELARQNLEGMAGREMAIVGQNICDIVAREPGQVFIATLRECFDARTALVKLDRAEVNGANRIWETAYTPEFDAVGHPIAVCVVSREITNEQRLRAERARIIAALPDSMIELDHRGICVFAHVAAGHESPFAEPAWAIPGMPVARVLGEELGALVTEARARAGEQVETFGYRMRGASATDSLREFEVRVAPSEGGGTVTILRDVTAERRLEAKMIVSERLASLGRVAAGIAHEINNPLTFLAANVELALEDTAASSPIHPLLVDIREGVERIRGITDDIRVLARPETQAAATADLGEVVRSVVRMMGSAVRRRARLVIDVPTLGRVRGPMPRLVQVVTNLLGNAIHALSEDATEGQRIEIRAAKVGGAIELTVRDNGRGIAAEDLGRVFEPFFTTKASEGMGLGLTISRGIILELGGSLTLESELGRGTIARVTLLPAGG